MDEFTNNSEGKKVKGSFFHILLCELPPKIGAQI